MDPQLVDDKEESKQVERILSSLILASWASYLIISLTGLYWEDWNLIKVTFSGSVIQTVPYFLLKRGHVRASNIIFVMNILGTITFIATFGQGIHDFAIMTYPIIILFAGLTLHGVGFSICVILALASIAWLVFGESSGLFVSKSYETPNWVDYIDMAFLLLVAASGVYLLVTNMRKNLARAHQEILQRKRMEEQLRYQGTHDALTGIYNRAFFEEELARFERSREFPVSVVIADVDGLKITNDTQGHAAGDELLRQATNVFRSVFRAGDVVARIGGDEFAALLPATDSTTAEQIVSRIREHLAEHNTLYPDLLVQLSIGVATAEKNNLVGAFTAADQRMYADKTARKANANHSPRLD